MGNFNFLPCGMEGLYVIEPKIFGDERGYFMETYQYEDFKAQGLDMIFVQDNQSLSKKGVLRGMHYQKKHPQGKLVRAVSGAIYDVAVDLRKTSSTYGRWFGVVLSEENKRMFYVPEGFAHGFLVISEQAVFHYKCTDVYHPEDEGGFLWNDPDIGIEWPITGDIMITLSDKDRILPPFKEQGFHF